MLLYHYTALGYLRYIPERGLYRDIIPLTEHPSGDLRTIWLTSEKARSSNLVESGCGPVGAMPVREWAELKIVIPREDRSLVEWKSYATGRLTVNWYRGLDEVSGNRSHTWFFYQKDIPIEWIKEIRDLQNDLPMEDWLRRVSN